MRVLRLGATGDDVKSWEQFLVGQELFSEAADGNFNEATKEATRKFQVSHGLDNDGSVGPLTLAQALNLGYGVLKDDYSGKDGPNWPPPPIDLSPLNGDQKKSFFGAFQFKPSGTIDNPEAVTILDGWYSKNIVSVEIPQLKGLLGTSNLTKFPFHKAGADQFSGVFRAWEKAGLIGLVKSWGGSYSARFIRGSRTVLSNHSYGSAFDINVPWNYLNTVPALVGKTGSIRELVPIANKLGLYWGGHFRRPGFENGRLDGMHFEIAKLLSKDEVESIIGAL